MTKSSFLEKVHKVVANPLVAGAFLGCSTSGLLMAGITVADYDLDPAPAGAQGIMAEFQDNIQDLNDIGFERNLTAYDVDIAAAELRKAQFLQESGQDIDVSAYEDILNEVGDKLKDTSLEHNTKLNSIARDMFDENAELGEENVGKIRSQLVDAGFDSETSGNFDMNFDAKALSQCQYLSATETFGDLSVAKDINECAVQETASMGGSYVGLTGISFGLATGLYILLLNGARAGASGARRRRQNTLKAN